MSDKNLGSVLGWTAKTDFVEVEGKTVEKLIGYFGGGGNEPTLNVGKYRGLNGWVDDVDDAVYLINEVDQAVLNGKADKSDIQSNIDILFSDLTTSTTYTNLLLANKSNVPIAYKNPTTPANNFLTFNSSGVATLPFTAVTGFTATIFGTTGVMGNFTTLPEFQPFKDYIDNYIKKMFKVGAEGYALSVTDEKSRLLFYSLINGAFGATKWDTKNIPGAALKEGEISRSNLNADVLSGLWQPLDPETGYCWAFLDKKNGIFWAVRVDGSFEVGKWSDNNIPGRALKEATIGLSKLNQEVLSGLWQPLDPSTGYINAILDAKNRKIVAATTDGWFEVSKLRALNFEYTLPDNSVSSQKLTQDLRDLINTGGTNSKVWFIGQKLVTLGDSITEQKRWQEYLVILTKMVWSSVETAPGLPIGPAGALVKMGYGGQTVRPVISSDGTTRPAGGSLYYRADYVQALAPNVIFVFGGQNDSPVESVVGTINDPVYTGPEVAAGDPNEPTFCSSYKGMMVKLMTQNPNARIYAMTRMWNGVFPTVVPTPTQKAGMDRINNAIRAICDLYSIPVIDLAKGIGITPYNASIFYSDSVHPNYEGGLRMANFIANNLN